MAAADTAAIEEGLRVYKGAGECETCHGWTGTGGRPDDDPPRELAPSLTRTALDREAMIELVSCGTSTGQMPRFLAAAWTEQRRCYGKTLADLAPDARPPRPYSVLSRSQIEAVVAFVQEFYQGKAMTLDNCIRYHGGRTRSCDPYR